MEFINKLGYKAGFVPMGDVNAQKRCYAYIGRAIDTIQTRINDLPPVENEPGVPPGTDEASLLKNEIRVFQNTRDLVEASEGKYNWKKAHMFWEYWDKIKHDVVEVVEGRDSDTTLKKAKIDELEEGRYDPTE
ncbi:hypothetical protein AWJ20_1443 [Sugiyamaella lignohabitans]|uniref:Uncharacterized protein n=1 Tax=Sugiyamaella lignohabitans TaxID=796027 RepID=A0A167DQ86_9ASCO|nr:uncharacterized protein AWJ20_1443 [Sugiyamaella lignohabitans]ANB13161.1 hypothetical protein AWJ20_1443 [Sugiyamaella lignohabitans]